MSDCEPSAADVGPRSHTGEAADLRSVAELLEPGGRLLLAEPLLGGVSANVMRLDIERPDHTTRSVVFRQHCGPESKGDQVGLARMEFELLGDLHRRGLAVAEPLLLDDSGKLTDPYLVSELIAGSTEVTETELSAALDQMAQFLADLHALDVGELTISGLVSIEDPAAGALRYLPATESGVAAKRALSGMVPIAPNEPVLLHGDYWPGNVLWHRGQLAAVIDWEDACLGDPLADLATARVELLCQYGPEATEHFTRSYLSRAPQVWEPAPCRCGRSTCRQRHSRRCTRGGLVLRTRRIDAGRLSDSSSVPFPVSSEIGDGGTDAGNRRGRRSLWVGLAYRYDWYQIRSASAIETCCVLARSSR